MWTLNRYHLYTTLIIVICLLLSAWGTADLTGSLAPDSPEYATQKTLLIQSMIASAQETPPYDSGPLRKSPLNQAMVDSGSITSALEITAADDFPVVYDLRTLGKAPAIENQGQTGSCWDFACINSLESSLLPGIEKDFSENNLKNGVSVYNPDGFDYKKGGNDLMAAAYFTRWSGPVEDDLDPYNPYSYESPIDLPLSMHVPDVPMIPGRTEPLGNDDIKWALQEYGALYTTLFYDDMYYNPEKAAYYCPESSSSNHAVTIVGWDDNANKDDFKTPAPGNGAFICANSWGTAWGEDGFFKVSYYDARIGSRITGFTATSTDEYDAVYQYDPFGWVGSYGYEDETAYGANVFTSDADETISAVGFYNPLVRADYTIQVYLSPDNGPISAGGPASGIEETIIVPGYHTIPLTTPVPVTKGQKFSVVIRYHTPGYGYPIAVEYPKENYSSKARSLPGQSYVSPDGAVWDDFTSTVPNGNVCIKAYTVRKTVPKADFTANQPLKGAAPLQVQFFDISQGNPTSWKWQFGDGDSSSEKNPSHIYKSNGRYSVKLTVTNENGSNTKQNPDYVIIEPTISITVPDDYPTIQTAVDAAGKDATVFVRYGRYEEEVTIATPLTLTGISDAGKRPIIDAKQKGNPVTITSGGVTVDNFALTGAYDEDNFRAAVAVVQADDVCITNNDIYENYCSIRADESDQITISKNVLSGSDTTALLLDQCTGGEVTDNSISDTEVNAAVGIRYCHDIIFTKNRLTNNRNYAIALDICSDIEIYNNYFENENNAWQGEGCTGVIWNSNKQEGPNIIEGPYIGGNYWATPDGTGFSQTHADTSGDGFCDEAYHFLEGAVDALPLCGATKPVLAVFSGQPRSGFSPLTVRFTDKSIGSIKERSWTFGDGDGSTDKDPVHIYQNDGSYTVSLSVSGSEGSDRKTEPGYIVVGVGPQPDLIVNLNPGWNLISTPVRLADGYNTGSIFSSIDVGGHSIFTYSASGDWQVIDRDTLIKPLFGYWIYSVQSGTIGFVFDTDPIVVPPQRNLNAGWTSIGYAGRVPVSADIALLSVQKKWVYLIGFDSVSQRYEETIINDETRLDGATANLIPGKGYWIYMDSAGTLAAYET